MSQRGWGGGGPTRHPVSVRTGSGEEFPSRQASPAHAPRCGWPLRVVDRFRRMCNGSGCASSPTHPFFFLARRKYQPVRTHGLHTVPSCGAYIYRTTSRAVSVGLARRGVVQSFFELMLLKSDRLGAVLLWRPGASQYLVFCGATSKNAKGVATLDCYSYSRFFFWIARLRETDLLPYTPGPHPGPLRGIFFIGVLPRGGRGLARRGIVELLRIKCFSQRASRRRTTAPQGASLDILQRTCKNMYTLWTAMPSSIHFFQFGTSQNTISHARTERSQ